MLKNTVFNLSTLRIYLKYYFLLQLCLINALWMKYKIKLRCCLWLDHSVQNNSKIPTVEEKHGCYTVSLLHYAQRWYGQMTRTSLNNFQLSVDTAYWKENALIFGLSQLESNPKPEYVSQCGKGGRAREEVRGQSSKVPNFNYASNTMLNFAGKRLITKIDLFSHQYSLKLPIKMLMLNGKLAKNI